MDASQFRRIDEKCDDFEAAWKAGGRPRIEDHLLRADPGDRKALFAELLRLDVEYRARAGETPREDEYRERFPDWQPTKQVSADDGPPDREGAGVPLVSGDEIPGEPGGVEKTAPFARRPASDRFRVGELVAGRYRIVALLGVGGMGEVYRAEDQTLDQTVALKFLPESRADDPDWIARLREEVARARQVSHPNVCRVHDIGEEAGRPFLTMEFIDGEDLSALLKSVGRLPPERVVVCGAQLCDALAALHENGLLHRDLKPSNILLDRRRRVRLLDFGIAALADRIHEQDHREGTLGYMAPEQLTGQDASVHSDLFALGLVLYELTTGRRPFPGRTPEELIRQHGGPAPASPSDLVPGIDPALNRVILGCLAIKAARRPASALDVKRGLPPLSPRETQEVEGTGRLRRTTAAGLLAAVLALVALHAWLAPRVMLWHQVPLDSPKILASDAREILKRLGYESRHDYSASGLAWDRDRIQDIRNRPGPDRWGDLATSRSPVLYFWYRTSPSPLHPSYLSSPADPPPLLPGMVCVILDTSGRLVELRALSKARPGVKAGVRDEGWEKALFEAAGLDRTAFREDELPGSPPPVYADEPPRGWTGKERGAAVRVEAAAYRGQAVYFLARADEGERGGPRDRIASSWHTRLIDSLTGPGQVVMGMVVLGGLILARRNLALGRADVQGTVRVGSLYLAFVVGGWLLTTSFLWTMPTARGMFVAFLGTVTYWLVVLVVIYLALEPSFRRRWPRRLSAWNRLVAGRYRDPLVGRDILLGVLAGLVINGLAKVLPLVDTWRGDTSWYLEWVAGTPIHGPDAGLGRMLSAFSSALVLTFLWAVLFLLMVLVFRREWLALGAVIALNLYSSVVSFLGMQAASAVLWVGSSLCVLAAYLVLIRVGVLGLLITCFVGMILAGMPLTMEPAEWLEAANLRTILLVVGLAAYGALVSLGGQPFLRNDL